MFFFNVHVGVYLGFEILEQAGCKLFYRGSQVFAEFSFSPLDLTFLNTCSTFNLL